MQSEVFETSLIENIEGNEIRFEKEISFDNVDLHEHGRVITKSNTELTPAEKEKKKL